MSTATLTETWTKPYHGVQHLGRAATDLHWFTVQDRGSFAELLHWFPGCGFRPTETIHDTAEQARAEGERLRALYA